MTSTVALPANSSANLSSSVGAFPPETLYDQFKKVRTQRTFDFFSQLLVFSFVSMIVYYNALMLVPFIMPLFWAVLWAIFLSVPINMIARSLHRIDKQLGGYKLHVYLVTSAIYLCIILASSLLTIIISTAVFALWSFILWSDRHRVATTVFFLALVVLVALPLYYSIISCIEESKDIAAKISTFIEENPQVKTLLDDFGTSPYYKWVKDYAAQWDVTIPEFDPEFIKGKITEFSLQFSGYFTNILGSVVDALSNSIQFFVSFITFLSFLFTILASNFDLAHVIITYSPFSRRDNEVLLNSLQRSVTSVFLSSILIALSNMIGTYIIFKLIGLDLALVLSFICGFTSVLPLISSWIVWVPVAISLFFTENYIAGILVVITELVLQGPVTSAIYSLIPGNTFLVSTSLAMGLYVFGTIGLVMGPLLAGITLTMVEIYQKYQSPETIFISQARIEEVLPNPNHTKSWEGSSYKEKTALSLLEAWFDTF